MSVDIDLSTIKTNNTIALSGGLDVDLDNIHVNVDKLDLPIIKLELKTTDIIRTDSTVDAGLDNIRIKEIGPVDLNLHLDNIRIKELPRIDLQLSVKPTRVHAPVNLKFGLSLLGLQLLSFDVCGEGMIVIEDYIKHKTEDCA